MLKGKRVAPRSPPRPQDPFPLPLSRSNFPLAAARNSPASSWSRTAWGRPVPAPPPEAGSGGPGAEGLHCRRDDLLREAPASPPALRFVPTGSRSPTAASTPGSAPKLTPARRGGAAAPRPLPTPGRDRPASCSRRGYRPGAPRGRPDFPGLGIQQGCANTRPVGVSTGHLLLRSAPKRASLRAPRRAEAHAARFSLDRHRGWKPSAKVRLQQQSLP